MVGIRVLAAFLWIAAGQSWGQADATLPVPSGGRSVGRASLHWVDPKRPEVATEAADDKREILVHVWYPAAKPDLQTKMTPDRTQT